MDLTGMIRCDLQPYDVDVLIAFRACLLGVLGMLMGEKSPLLVCGFLTSQDWRGALF